MGCHSGSYACEGRQGNIVYVLLREGLRADLDDVREINALVPFGQAEGGCWAEESLSV